MARVTRFSLLLFCLGFTILAFHDIASFVDSSKRGLLLFSNSVLPVLFPFFFITSLAVHSGVRKPWQIFTFSLLGGFPTSARMIAELYERNQITKIKAHHLSTYTSFPSPIFIIATVGISLFSSLKLGIIVFASIILAALLNGFIFRRILQEPGNQQRLTSFSHNEDDGESFSQSFSNSLHSAVQSILLVGGLIVIFFIVGSQVDSLFNLPSILDILVSSTLEMTAGVFKLQQFSVSGLSQIVAVTAILCFSGICIGLQGLLFFKRFGMTLRFYLLYKLTHTAFAVAIAALIYLAV
ncbi:MAG: hypothetical protein FWE31_01355 [Firmicutes bacterium]|nr:hypothetical protein [Bacillota bacterium]